MLYHIGFSSATPEELVGRAEEIKKDYYPRLNDGIVSYKAHIEIDGVEEWIKVDSLEELKNQIKQKEEENEKFILKSCIVSVESKK